MSFWKKLFGGASDTAPTSPTSTQGNRGKSTSSAADRILTPEQIDEVLADDYGSSEAVIFVYDQSGRPIMPSDMIFYPLLNAQFSEDPKLGMIYGTGSGCALLRVTALKKVQSLQSSGQRIASCQPLMDALQHLGYTVKQDPMLNLDLQQ